MSTDAGPRTGHRFFMYDAMLGQPDAFRTVCARLGAEAPDCVAPLTQASRLYVVGIGTSYHAAQVGEHLMRAFAGVPVQAVHAFDFALYGPPIGPTDAVIAVSHRGTKRYTAASLRRARDAGSPTVLITGEAGAAAPAEADFTLRTVPQERSSAHTISYTGAVAALAALADWVGARRSGRRPLGAAVLEEEIPGALRAALDTERCMDALARAHAHHRRIWVVGGGPGTVTAQEIALKIKETSYLQAEGLGVEPMLHGPFQCVEPEDLFILVASHGPALERVSQLAGPVRTIGASLLVVGDDAARSIDPAACVVPRVAEPFAALTCTLPLQLFAYHLALVHGTNPDRFRLDDPRFARAYPQVTL